MSDETGPPDEPEVADRIEPVEIEQELQRSYLDYAMSVIVGRALPDVRDGLKPVHRRILFAMFEGGMRAGTQHRKSAAAVGDVMKKYHPHGDAAVYDALVRMAQDWAIRYPLVEGHGNFGSIDGDPPAAMRYTEARLSQMAMELLRDIDEDTVDFVDNYDGQEVEPTVLPARFPSLLVNGSSGIAVGMATNVPPHNLGEMIDAITAVIEDPDIDLDGLRRHVPGPDFPTGGIIMGTAGIEEAYATGRGSIKVRAVTEIEEGDAGDRIVVTELPYQVNKANVAERIAELVRGKRIEGIRDLRDETSREGMRLVVELRRDANPQVVLNRLFKMTQLEDAFGVINLSLVDGVPRILSLRETIDHYIAHQIEIITRRTRHRLARAEERAHVLEGLLIAIGDLDAVIDLIRSAASADEASTELQRRYDLSEVQARAILDMQLRRLAALERQRLQAEHDELQATIAELRALLADPTKVRALLVEELGEVRERFADDRRSRIVPAEGDLDVEDLIADEEVVITLSRAGYLKRTPIGQYRAQRRGGKGVSGAALRDDDLVAELLVARAHDWLLLFTTHGRVHRVKVWQVPEKSRAARGTYVANVPGVDLEQDETIAEVVAVRDLSADDRFLVFGTRQGNVKRTRLSAYDSPRSTLIAIRLREGDELVDVEVTDGDDDLIMVSRGARAIRFHECDARPQGRVAGGVRGMRLPEGDEVLAMRRADDDGEVLVVTEGGFGKRTPVTAYPRQRRGGMGVLTARLTEERGGLAGALVVLPDQQIFLVTDTGTVVRTDVRDVRPTGRATQGVRLMTPREGASVVSVAPVREQPDDEAAVDEAGGEDADAGAGEPGATADAGAEGVDPARG